MSTYHRARDYLLSTWGHLGVEQTPDGCVFIGPLPECGEYARLHRLLPPLNESGVTDLERQLQMPLPEPLRLFLLESNGASFYFGRISGTTGGMPVFNIYGLRTVYRVGSIENLRRQPYDMVIENIGDAFAHETNTIKVTKYPDGSRVYVDADGKLFRVREDGAQANKWASLEGWLMSELERMKQFFDESGRAVVDPELMAPPWRMS